MGDAIGSGGRRGSSARSGARAPLHGLGFFHSVLLALVAATGCGRDRPPLVECVEKDGLTPICRFQGPEDLAAVGSWLVVSQMPTSKSPGSLVAYHPATGALRMLYPPTGDALGAAPAGADAAAASSAAASASDGGCAAGEPPPAADFAPHGLDVSGTRLLVVHHGRREAIEEFALGQDALGPTLVWKACTPLPADANANDVVALEDGGFAATKMLDRSLWRGIPKLLLGLETGALLRYSPATRAWETVPSSQGKAPNGVAVGPDGRFFVAEWTGNRIARIEPDGSGRATVPLDFSPDNLAWSSDGRLLVAGQRGSVFDVTACATEEQGTCALPSVVVAIDPTTLEVSPLVDDDPSTVIGAASSAVELEGDLYVGAFAGDRIVKREGVR